MSDGTWTRPQELALLAHEAEERGEAELAADLWDDCLALVSAPVEDGDLGAVPAYMAVAARTVGSHQEVDPERALTTARRIERVAAQSGVALAELGAVELLLRLSIAMDDPAETVRCAVALASVAARAAADEACDPPDLRIEPGSVPELLGAAAGWLYHEHEDHEGCARVCRAARALAPQDAELAALLAFSLTRLGHDEAPAARLRAIELDPVAASLRAGLAQALAEAGRLAEALEQQQQAVELRPDNPAHRLTKGRLLQLLDEHDAAIAEFEALLAAAPPVRPPDAPGDLPDEGLSDDDLRDIAAVARLASLLATGRAEQAAADAAALLPSADAPTGRALRRRLAEALTALGRVDEAADAYRQLLSSDPDPDPEPAADAVRVCEALIAAGHTAEAVAHLDRLADLANPRHDPWSARKLLLRIVEAEPATAGALRALGHAHTESGHPAQGVAVLEEVLRADPGDSWARVWLGLALVTRSDEEVSAEEGWNDGFTSERLFRSLAELATAGAVPGDHRARALHLFGWVLQRAALVPGVIPELLADTPLRTSVLTALPDLRHPFACLSRADELDEHRQWSQAASEFREAAEALDLLALPLLGAWAMLRQADVRTRLYDLQSALDLLDQVDARTPLLGLPPHASAEQRAETQALAQRYARRAKGMVTLPLEHLMLGVAAFKELTDWIAWLRSDVDVRLGAAADPDGPPDGAPGSLGTGGPHEPLSRVFHRVVLLRDAGRSAEAAALLEDMPTDWLSPEHRLRRANLLATVLLRDERCAEAVRVLEAALDAEDTTPYGRAVLTLNLASAHERGGAAERALGILDGIDPEPASQYPISQRMHELRAHVLMELERPAEALAESLAALDLSDQYRPGLRTVEARITWQGLSAGPYVTAMFAAYAAEDLDTFFVLLERSKSRVLLDQLESARLAAPADRAPDARELAEAKRRRAELRRLLTHTPQSQPLVEAVEEETRTIARLEERFGRTITFRADDAVGAVLGPQQVARELARTHGEQVLLVEYVQLGDLLFMLLLRPDLGLVGIEAFELASDELNRLIDELFPEPEAGAGTPRLGPALEALAFLVEPVRPYVEDGDVLWIVPSGVLHGVPFHAVPLDGVPLQEGYPVAYTPSASVLALCAALRDRQTAARAADVPPEQGRWTRAVVIGDSRSDLPHARAEATAVAERFGTTAILGAQATEDRLRLLLARTPGPDLLHLACHGRFDRRRALGSGIALAPGPGHTAEEAELSAQDILALGLSTDLVVLSACDSGLSEHRPGDELIGLPRALLQAGTPTVLVTLWPVDDLSTQLVVEAFYRHARPAGPVTLAHALRLAQREVARMTAADVVTACEQRARTAHGADALRLRLDQADARIQANDLAAALADYRAIADQASSSTDPSEQAVGALAADKLPLLEIRATLTGTIDYQVKPFEDPYHWAAFMLVGDWR